MLAIFLAFPIVDQDTLNAQSKEAQFLGQFVKDHAGRLIMCL